MITEFSILPRCVCVVKPVFQVCSFFQSQTTPISTSHSSFHPPKRKLHEVLAKVIFLHLSVIHSVYRGGVSAPNFRGGCLLQIFGGGVCSKFGGGVCSKFWGGSAPNFRGGVCSNFSEGVSAPNFWGGVCSNFSEGGVCSKFLGVGGWMGVCSKFLGVCLLQIFGVGVGGWMGVCSKFSGGCLLQIFWGGVSAPNFQGGLQFSKYGQRSAGTHPTGMHSCYRLLM